MNLILLRAQLRGLSAFRSLLDTPMLKDALQLLDAAARRDGEGALAAYDQMFYRLKAEGYSGLGTWMWDTLRYTETPYGDLAGSGRSDPELEGAARRDVDALLQLARLGAEDIRVALKPILTEEYVSVLDNLPAWETGAPFTFEELAAFYRENGAGLYAKYRAFLWEEGRLVPVADPDCPHPVELLGYDQQRKQVLDNTRLLVEGKPSNNVLLFGDGGTGKSATVKSMLYLPGMENLRLIEIQKENLVGMPRLIRSLAGRRQSFILFIDDLAFDQDDKTYSSLKTILEGGLEKRPLNVAIYATSNRRHLVRQTFSDRAGDEVDAFETISEKTALAERFGLRIPYMTMSKAEYLALIDHLAGLYHVEMNREVLHAKAMEWEIRHAGRTPRVARQFIASLNL
ncbi:ATP-binding protein [Pseudoflavonifractor capillosus]|uniref:ATP-binding protein n=1 Tax=Pseudoflavonifractor capillosus TaxID=106588 RepID=UPI0019569E8B|nr:ATP-binding protein [Pseudoflavonifractor capillosus]MBM6680760.1 ATP-binding protein [Pseudoflavonifractor capillosus]